MLIKLWYFPCFLFIFTPKRWVGFAFPNQGEHMNIESVLCIDYIFLLVGHSNKVYQYFGYRLSTILTVGIYMYSLWFFGCTNLRPEGGKGPNLPLFFILLAFEVRLVAHFCLYILRPEGVQAKILHFVKFYICERGTLLVSKMGLGLTKYWAVQKICVLPLYNYIGENEHF